MNYELIIIQSALESGLRRIAGLSELDRASVSTLYILDRFFHNPPHAYNLRSNIKNIHKAIAH